MFKKLIVLALVLAIAVGAGYQYMTSSVQNFVGQPLRLEEKEFVTVGNGTSLNSLMKMFIQKKWIEQSFVAGYLHRLRPDLVAIKAGTYQISRSDSLESALKLFISGKEYQFSITFVEGSRFSEWREILKSAPHLKQTIETLSETEIAKRLGIDRAKLEGLFLAETYHYTQGMSDLDILFRAHHDLNLILDKAWQTHDQKLPLKNEYEALTLASIIEKETAVAEERNQIASVFINRLNRGMRLQTDPTVIYGLGEAYDGNIRRRDLSNPTPYNTYVINGLPPTPIAMVGAASIEAALNPSDSSYLYFVASGKGGHVFSKSLAEHNRAVKNYLKQLRLNR